MIKDATQIGTEAEAAELKRSVLKIDKKCAVKTKHINEKGVE